MNRKTRALLLIIGVASILAGALRFFQGDSIDTLLAGVIGITFIGAMYYSKKDSEKDNEKSA